MNTLMDIALTVQPLKARHCPTVELLCLSWERSCVQTSLYTRKLAHVHNNKNHYNLYAHFTQLIPDLLINTRRDTPPSIKQSHTCLFSTPTPPCHIIPALVLTLQHRLSPSVFLYFSPFLPWFSFCFHGSVERAITSASVWRPRDEELCGCGQTPGHG